VQERGAVAPLTSARARRMLLAAGVAAVVVAVDQATKSLAEAGLHGPVHLVGPLGLALGYNSGSAFSLFTGAPAVLGAVALVLVGVLVFLAWTARSAPVAAAVGLVLGGALGNLADRAFRGHHGDVVDFITLSHWPTFNVADACITVGVVLLVVLYWRGAGPGARAGAGARAGGEAGGTRSGGAAAGGGTPTGGTAPGGGTQTGGAVAGGGTAEPR
jgi:signal peptidase II